MEVSENKNKSKARFWALSKKTTILIIILISVVVLSMISLLFYNSINKYQVLFSNLESRDSQALITKLEEQQIDYKIEGNSILVPKENVDKLRLTLASEITFGSSGYELMDFSGTFGISDQEFEIKKQVMQQGELERTIKSFPQIENTRVHITYSKDSVFIENKEPAKASVYVKLAAGQKLKNEQVNSIISLVSGAVENLPKENIQVIDDNMNLLSANLLTGSTEYNTSESVNTQLEMKTKYESMLKETVLSLLEPVYGSGKVRVAINSDLDFDSKQKTELIVDKENVIISQEKLKESTVIDDGTETDSPVDNNVEEEDVVAGSNNVLSSSESETTNYEVGKTENVVISAPGKVERLTASIIIDTQIDDLTRQNIINLISTAIGINNTRNDEINVYGMNFDKSESENESNLEVFEEMKKEMQTKSLILYGAIGVGALIFIIIIIITLKTINKKKKEDEPELENEEIETIDVISAIQNAPHITEQSINSGLENKYEELEEEIKKYAMEKPNQVVDIIKSWITENEK